jgi:hypothetical protein
MDRFLPKQMMADVMSAVGASAINNGIVDVSAVAEHVRERFAHMNVAREDIEALVVHCGAALSAPMEISTFDDIGFSKLVAVPFEPAPTQPEWGSSTATWGIPIQSSKAAQAQH